MNACIPLAIQIVIDDVGWWCGKNSTQVGGPYRTSINRDHVPEDYAAIVQLGKSLNMRPQAALVLCEWDRTNMLKNLPSSTWMGKDWDNSIRIGPWIDKAAQILSEGGEYVELALHGVGHEFWYDGTCSRTEFYDACGNMRDEAEINAHLSYFERLMRQNMLGAFPESFVPPAFLYGFGTGKNGIAAILSKKGIKYISTAFVTMFKSKQPQQRFFGIDEGIITIDRGASDLFEYYSINPSFNELIDRGTLKKHITSPICGMHWPNLLHENPEKNEEVVKKWVEYMKANESQLNIMLAPNTKDGFSQVIYKWGVELEDNGYSSEFSFKNIMNMTNIAGIADYFYFKSEGNRDVSYVSEGLAVEKLSEKCCKEYNLFKIHRDRDCSKGYILWQPSN